MVAGLAGLLLTQDAFQAGPITASQATLTIVDPIVSIVIGVGLFDDELRGGSGALTFDAVALLVMCSRPLHAHPVAADRRIRRLRSASDGRASSSSERKYRRHPEAPGRLLMVVTYLDRIAAWHREAASVDERDVADLPPRCALGAPPARDFAAAIAARSMQPDGGCAIALVAEIKRRSPSKGDSRPQISTRQRPPGPTSPVARPACRCSPTLLISAAARTIS